MHTPSSTPALMGPPSLADKAQRALLTRVAGVALLGAAAGCGQAEGEPMKMITRVYAPVECTSLVEMELLEVPNEQRDEWRICEDLIDGDTQARVQRIGDHVDGTYDLELEFNETVNRQLMALVTHTGMSGEHRFELAPKDHPAGLCIPNEELDYSIGKSINDVQLEFCNGSGEQVGISDTDGATGGMDGGSMDDDGPGPDMGDGGDDEGETEGGMPSCDDIIDDIRNSYFALTCFAADDSAIYIDRPRTYADQMWRLPDANGECAILFDPGDCNLDYSFAYNGAEHPNLNISDGLNNYGEGVFAGMVPDDVVFAPVTHTTLLAGEVIREVNFNLAIANHER